MKQFDELSAHLLFNLYLPGLNAYSTSSWLQGFKTTWGPLNFWYTAVLKTNYIYIYITIFYLRG